MGREAVLDGELRHRAAGPLFARLVDRDAAGDREDPGTQVAAVLQPRVGTECAEERLLKSVLCARAQEPAQVGEDGFLVFLVKGLERWDAHRLHLEAETHRRAEL